MRVLHVIPSLAERSGGPAAALVPMCRALQAEGVDVLLATTSHGLTQTSTENLREYKGVPSRFFPVQLGASFKYSRPLTNWLRSSVKDFDVVHIHAVFNHSSVAAASACRKAGVPYVVRPLGTLDPWSMKQKPVRKHLFWFLFAKRLLQGSAAMHYTAAAEKAATEKYLGLNHGRVIPLGVQVKGAHHSDLLRKQDPYLLSLSRLHWKKGLDQLIEAFNSLNDQRWRLIVAGDGPRDYLELLKSKARNSPRIVFTGWVEGNQKEELIRGASLFVLPSRHENFGLSVVEAMACAVPVLVSPHVNLAAEIQNAEAGWVVDFRDLKDALESVICDEAERLRRGRAAYELAKRFSWDNVATDLTELYEEVLSRT